jgi:hypothetical protein
MTVFEWQAASAENAANMLAFWVQTTKADWLEKQPYADPESKTRSILDYVGECIRVNRMAAAKLRGEEPGETSTDGLSMEEVCSQLKSSAKEYADAIRSQDDSMLGKKYTLPFGEFDGAFMVSMPIFNMIYHGGQVNYVQTLYGDTEFRFPGE